MPKKNNNSLSFNPPKQHWILPLTILFTILFNIGPFVISTFVPNFIKIPDIIKIFVNPNTQNYVNTNLCDYIQTRFFSSGNASLITQGTFYWLISSLAVFFGTIFGFDFIKKWIVAISYKPWMKNYIIECANIIESADPSTFNDKVAILVPTCNDLTENAILQTTQQTYKNVDCWIIDDSFLPEQIERIKNFIKLHPEIKYFKRSDEHRKAHPSEMGNIMGWVEAHGDEYDYIIETNCSSLLTKTFVENSLCYFHSPLLKDKNIGGILASGGFYHSNTFASWVVTKNRQLTFSTLHNSSVIGTRGQDIVVRGWGTMYSTKAIKSIDWKKGECPVCDVARGRELIKNNFTILLNPFDFSSKVCIRDIHGYRKQVIKWNEGHIHMLRNKISWGECVKGKPFYMKWCSFFYAFGPIFFLISFGMNIVKTIFSIIVVINYQNFTADLLKISLQAIVMVPLLLASLINGVSILTLLSQIFFIFIDRTIYWYKLYDTIFTSFIFKKWSSKFVSKKSNKNSSFSKKLRLCWKDGLWVAILLGLCFGLQFGVHMPVNLIWNQLFTFLSMPSIFYIIWVFIGEIRVKSGWTADKKYWPDFYKTFDLNYKVIKDHPIWIRQHQDDCNQVNKTK